MRLYCLIAFAALNLFFSTGCLSQNHLDGGPGSGAPPDSLLQQIPFPDESGQRAVSADFKTTIPGCEDFLCSPAASENGLALDLLAAPQALEWAIYRLPTNGYPASSVEINLVIADGPAYFGIANFTKQAWDFHGEPIDTSFSSPVAPSNLSPQEWVYAVVIAYDEAEITVSDAGIMLDQPGWTGTSVAVEPTYVRGVQLLANEPGGYPCIIALSPGYIVYYSATKLHPENSGDWSAVTARTAGEFNEFTRPLKAGIINGRPAMAYLEDLGHYQLCYTYATAAQPGLGDWATCHVGETNYLPTLTLGFCELGNAPRLLYKSYDTDSILLASSSTDTPGLGDWTITTVEEGALRPSLAVVNGMLACSYRKGGEGDVRPYYARATNPSPIGPSSWVKMSIWGPSYSNYYSMTDVVAIPLGLEQAPAVAFMISGPNNPKVSCSNAAEPSTGNWHCSSLDPGADAEPFSMELKLVGGKPALAYYLEDLRNVQFAWADSANPETRDDWQVTTIATALDVNWVALAEVGGQPAIAYAEEGTGEIRYAYYTGD